MELSSLICSICCAFIRPNMATTTTTTNALATCETCVPANPELACTVVVAFVILIHVICAILSATSNKIGPLIECIANELFGKWGSIFISVVKGVAEGAGLVYSACPATLALWDTYLPIWCPDFVIYLTTFLNVLK